MFLKEFFDTVNFDDDKSMNCNAAGKELGHIDIFYAYHIYPKDFYTFDKNSVIRAQTAPYLQCNQGIHYSPFLTLLDSFNP